MPLGLSARDYLDPGVLSLERERVFARSWQPAIDLSALEGPGSYAAAEVIGEPLVFTRDDQDTLRAHANVCRHRGGALAVGCGKRKSLQCRYHGWTYGLDGRLLHAPEMEGSEGFVPSELSLASVAADTWGPFGFVRMSSGPGPTLAETLGEIVPECAPWLTQALHKVARRDYSIDCNWKIYVENYLEGYHVPIAHPSLNRVIDYSSYRVETRARHSLQHAPIKPITAQGAFAKYYWIHPNWMLNVYPDNLSINVVVPLGPAKCLTIFEWYFAEKGASEAIEKTVAFSDEIQKEDIGLCEAVQARLSSRFHQPGPLSALRENGVAHFHGLLRADLRAL